MRTSQCRLAEGTALWIGVDEVSLAPIGGHAKSLQDGHRRGKPLVTAC